MTLQEEPRLATWLEAPEATVLGIRRAFKEGGSEQWAIVAAGDGITLRKAVDGGWADVREYADIPAVLAGQPELALQRPGRATWFDLADNARIGDDELVRLLDPCAAEVSDEPGWADDAGWEDGQIWEWTSHLDFVRRLVCITDPGSEWNARQVSWLDFHGIHPVIADEDGFVGERIASFSISFTGNSMVGYTGGSQLVLVAPGTAVSIPTGDAHEVGEFPAGCFPYPDEGNIEERAAVIADWLAYSDMYGAEVPVHLGLHAALQFEPFDPHLPGRGAARVVASGRQRAGGGGRPAGPGADVAGRWLARTRRGRAASLPGLDLSQPRQSSSRTDRALRGGDHGAEPVQVFAVDDEADHGRGGVGIAVFGARGQGHARRGVEDRH
ncbi:MAG TPA: hypothetical protein VMA72_06985 [Streptosporangiaceae bacterium]|nr:hypothetical protein [Streptosporangiaceae bacterium]